MSTKPIQVRERLRVGEVLLKRNLITRIQLKQALAIQQQCGGQLGTILVEQGWVSSSQLQQALNEQYWHNLAVTALVSISTLMPGATQWVATPAATNAAPHHQANHLDDNQTESTASYAEHKGPNLMGLVDIGGAAFEGASAQPEVFDSVALTKQPLHNNPTVASPLRGFCHPLNGKGWLSQGIRGRTHRGRMEYAYDLAAAIGTPVYAMRSGRVISVQDKYPDTGGGKDRIAKFNYVWLEHEGGYRSAYIHLQQGFVSNVNIKAGDWVDAGQLVGYSGNSGWSSGPHLHLEVQRPGHARRFSKTAPFAISGACSNEKVARR